MGKYNKFQYNQQNQQKNMQDLKDAVENVNATQFSDNQSSFENMDNGHVVRDAEIQSDNESKWPDVLGIAIVALLLIGIITTAVGKGGDNKSQVANTGSSVESGEEMSSEEAMDDDVLTVTEVNEIGATTDVKVISKTPVVAPANFSNVKVALLGEAGKVQGVTRGCDVVFMVNRSIAPTTAPLNSALQELFKKDSGIDSTAGNFIAAQSKLGFDKATLENGVASIFLTGEIGPYENECDRERAFIQIRETALQFTTVKSVVFYLDGKKLDN